MISKTVLYQPVRWRFARIGALVGLVLVFSHYVLGQGGAAMSQWTLDLWVHHLLASGFLVGFFAVSAYATGSLKDRKNPGPTERVVWRPVRRRWAAYGAIAGFLLAAVEYFHLLGTDKLEPWTATFTLHDGVSAVVTVGLCALVCFVVGIVRDASTS